MWCSVDGSASSVATLAAALSLVDTGEEGEEGKEEEEEEEEEEVVVVVAVWLRVCESERAERQPKGRPTFTHSLSHFLTCTNARTNPLPGIHVDSLVGSTTAGCFPSPAHNGTEGAMSWDDAVVVADLDAFEVR